MNAEMTGKDFQEKIEIALLGEDLGLITVFLDDQHISDISEYIYEYPAMATVIVGHMSVNRAAAVFKLLDLAEQKRIIKELPTFKTARLLNELQADDRTDFFEELPTEVIRDLIKLLDPDERKITLQSLGYPEDSVGRMMTPDYIYVYVNDTINEVLQTIRHHARNTETIDVIYVINEQGKLVDDLRIRDIILAGPNTRISELIDGRYTALHVMDDQEEAANAFKMNNRVALPVTDENNVLLGIITIDDMLWVADEEFSEDIQKIGGTEALSEPYLDTPFFKLIKKRVGWLIILFVGEMLTATAMAFFSDEIEKAVILSIFVPLIISTGGNSGSQASTLIIQALALGDISVDDWWRVMRREIFSGIVLGGILGLIGFFRIVVWHYLMQHGIIEDIYGSHWLPVAFCVGFSLIGVVLWGTLSGSMLPIFLKRCGADPAVSSAPFVATLVDVTGLLIYFSLAWVFMQDVLS
jgi:magnesium transporter